MEHWRPKRALAFFAALIATTWIVADALAEVEKVELYLYGGITQRSKHQIVRQLSPYVVEDGISFRQMIREDGSEHPWVTVVEIEPRGWFVDFYDLVHRIKDDRGVNDGRVLWKTEVTASGDLRAHYGFTRRSFGWIPGWVQARGLVTSGLWHHLYATGSQERMVFHPNSVYDDLRMAPHRGEDVRVRGRIAGFDGPYPVVVLGEFENVEPRDEDRGQDEGAIEEEARESDDVERPRRSTRPMRRYTR